MRILVTRLGAFGDMLICSPLLRFLKEQGNDVYLHTSERGMELMKLNPNVDKFISYKSDSVPAEKLDEYFKATAKAYEVDKHINLCESIELALALHPSTPEYNIPKMDKMKRFNKNYYDYTFTHAGYEVPENFKMLPELFFEEKEHVSMKNIIDEIRGKDGYVILWGLSGSGRNKTFVWTDYVQTELLQKYPNVKIITVGDNACQMLEVFLEHDRVVRRSRVWDIRTAMLATKYVDLVVSPDTGLLHAAGCYPTPKIGLLGHSTIENITKHFENDYSIQANCDCAPCFRLIYEARCQCPLDEVSSGVYCMSVGLKPDRVYEHIAGVIDGRATKNT